MKVWKRRDAMVRRAVRLLLLVALLRFTGIHGLAQTSAEIEEALKVNREASAAFIELIDGMGEEQWSFKNSKFRQTIGEEAEHIALAEFELQGVIGNAMKEGEDPETARQLAGKEETVRQFMLNPESRAEFFTPPHRLKTRPEVQEFYRRAHRSLLRTLETTAKLGSHIYKHPTEKYGNLTALQWFHYIAYHKLRHCKQIKEMMAEPDYPSGVQKTD